MNPFSFFYPISYQTDVNSFLFNYYYRPNYYNIGSIGPVYNFTGNNETKSNNYSYTPIFNIYKDFRTNNNWNRVNYSNNNNYNLYNTSLFQNPYCGPIYNFTGRTGLISYTEPPKDKVTKPAEKPAEKPVEQPQQPQTKEVKKAEAEVQQGTTASSYTPPGLKKDFVTNANKYMGINEADGSWKQISESKEWCADFVSHVVDETYKERGLVTPPGFINHRVEDMMIWANENKKFFNTTEQANKGKAIAENIKPGDIMILYEDGASHTGIVKEVNPDGSFTTIEGNRDDAVKKGYYYPDEKMLSGFVQLSA